MKKKQRGVVNSLHKLFQPAKTKSSVEEEKIQQAIAKLLRQVNLIMLARNSRRK